MYTESNSRNPKKRIKRYTLEKKQQNLEVTAKKNKNNKLKLLNACFSQF